MDRQKLIEDTIEVNAINRDGQVFDRGKSRNEGEKFETIINCCFILLVSRIAARSQVNRLEIELDVNTDIYPMA